jgi:glycerophosphoryl diester phosphodiesterase
VDLLNTVYEVATKRLVFFAEHNRIFMGRAYNRSMNKLHPLAKAAIIIVAVIISIWLLIMLLNVLPWAPAYPGVNPMRIEPGGRPHIVPHGGAKELYPENTVLSYREMNRNNWNTFEVDLCLTADSQLITHHDLDIEGSAGIAGTRVRDLSYAEISSMNFAVNFTDLTGNRPFEDVSGLSADTRAQLVPARLEDLFAWFPDNYYILELKDTVEESGQANTEEAVAELIRLIEAYGMQDRVVVSSFDDDVTSEFRKRTGGSIPTGAATMDALILSVLSALNLDFFLRPAYSSVMLPVKDQIYPAERALIERLPRGLRDKLSVYEAETDTLYTNLANPRMVRDAHRKNLAVYYWTVNDRETMEYLIGIGVDGIITDRPDILADLLEDMGW